MGGHIDNLSTERVEARCGGGVETCGVWIRVSYRLGFTEYTGLGLVSPV
jgi:hypothetical protein